jgi:hypothetical protein
LTGRIFCLQKRLLLLKDLINMSPNVRKLRRRSLFLTLGFTGLFAASGAQALLIDAAVEDTQIEVLPVEAEEFSVDQPELAAPDDIVEPVDEMAPIDVIDQAIEEPEVGIQVDPTIEEPQVIVDPVIEEPEVGIQVDPTIEEPQVIVDPTIEEPQVIVDPVIEEPEVGIQVDPTIEEPQVIVDPVIEEPEVGIQVDPTIEEPWEPVMVEDQPKDAVDPLADIPIEWMLRDADQVAMYSMSGAGGIDDAADDVASRAAEKVASRSLDEIDAALPVSANPK